MEAQEPVAADPTPLSAVVKLERIREALQSWRDEWTEPHSTGDFDDDDVDEIMAVLEEVEEIVDAPDADPHGTPAAPVVARGDDAADRRFEDALWREREETRILREVDRRPPPEGLIIVLSIAQYGDAYGCVEWMHWLAGYLKRRGCFDPEVDTVERWRGRVRSAVARDMLRSNGVVVDGEYQGRVRYKLTERGRLELEHYLSDHPRVVREPQ